MAQAQASARPQCHCSFHRGNGIQHVVSSSPHTQWHPRARHRHVACQAGSGSHGSRQPDKVMEGLKELAAYVAPTVAAIRGSDPARPVGTSSGNTSDSAVAVSDWRSPVYTLIAALVIVHMLGTLIPLNSWLLGLGSKFHLHQVVTSGFVHSNPMHLAETMFMVYTFGRVIERTHGPWALWLAYLASTAGASAMMVWLLPVTKATLPLTTSTASAAALGLFVAGLAWRRLARKPLEVLVLAPWVIGAACARYAPLSNALVVNGQASGHLAPLFGASLAASAVAAVLRLVDMVRQALEDRQREQARQEAERQRAQRNNTQQEAVADVLGTAAKAASALAKKIVKD